jgi:hypothetical protein
MLSKTFFLKTNFRIIFSNRLMNHFVDIVERKPWPIVVVSPVVVRVTCPEIAPKDQRELQERWAPREEAASTVERRTISHETALKVVPAVDSVV